MQLNTEWVDHLFKDCRFTDREVDSMPPNELAATAVKAFGLTNNVGFNPDRLKANETLIIELLKELPVEIRQYSGGGVSFLRMPYDRGGKQWGEQPDAEKLLLLGLGIGKLEYMLPRHTWDLLPGGVPYVMFRGIE